MPDWALAKDTGRRDTHGFASLKVLAAALRIDRR